jgi:hypothetical protein
MSVLFLPSASILTARNLISGLPSSPFLNQNLKTDTRELELNLGKSPGEETRAMPKKGHTPKSRSWRYCGRWRVEAGAKVAEICRKAGISHAAGG